MYKTFPEWFFAGAYQTWGLGYLFAIIVDFAFIRYFGQFDWTLWVTYAMIAFPAAGEFCMVYYSIQAFKNQKPQ